MRRGSRLKTETLSSHQNKPFQTNICSLLVDRCEKITHQLQDGNAKIAADLIVGLDKDLILLHSNNPDYSRLQSLVLNTKAAYYRKIGQNDQSLKLIDEAISLQKGRKADKIDMARTLLNKSVLMGQMARSGKITNLYSHEAAIQLAKQALQLIADRPENKSLVKEDQTKLGELIIVSFHNIATELKCLNNEEEAYNLYKKAYQLAIRTMGLGHTLTLHLKQIIAQQKERRKRGRKTITEEIQRERKQPPQTRLSRNSQKIQGTKKYQMQKRKQRLYLKAYGCSKSLSKSHKKIYNQKEIKKQSRIQTLSNMSLTKSTYLPPVQKKHTKQLIDEKTSKQIKQEDKRKKSMLILSSIMEPLCYKRPPGKPNLKSLSKPTSKEEQVSKIDIGIQNSEMNEQEQKCQLI